MKIVDIIDVKNLTKIYSVHQKQPGLAGSLKSLFRRRYKQVTAVNDISFTIAEGELVGFIGPNGAGKTTTLKMLSGLLYPTSGQILVNGFIPWQRKPQFQKQFAFVAGQKNQLWWDLPAQETFLLNKEIYEVKDADFRQRINYLSKMLDIADLLNTPVKKLSLGQRMKAELVAALIHQPKILYLDEPTIGLDIVAQNNMRQFIKNYNRQFGATIILTSHYMGDVEKLCQRIIIINKGQIIYDGKLRAVAVQYAKYKTIHLDFNKEIEKNQLKEFGKVIEFNYPSGTIEVGREQVAEVTSQLLKKFDIADLSIAEPPIEEVITRIFTKGK